MLPYGLFSLLQRNIGMAKRKVIRKRLVEVTWVDPQTRAGWHEDDECVEFTPIKTFGLYVRKDKSKDCLTIAASYEPEDNKWTDKMDFPLGCVKKIREIEVIEYEQSE